MSFNYNEQTSSVVCNYIMWIQLACRLRPSNTAITSYNFHSAPVCQGCFFAAGRGAHTRGLSSARARNEMSFQLTIYGPPVALVHFTSRFLPLLFRRSLAKTFSSSVSEINSLSPCTLSTHTVDRLQT